MCIVEINILLNVPIICKVFGGYSNTQSSQEYFHFLPQLCSPLRGSRSVPVHQPLSGLNWGCPFWEFMASSFRPHSTLNRWVQTRCNGGTASSATGRHSLTRGQEEMWDFSPLRSQIHSFFLQTLFFPPFSLPALKASCSAHLAGSCFHTTNTNSWVGSFYIKINRSLKTPREAGRQH